MKSSVAKPPGVPSTPPCCRLRGVQGSKPRFFTHFFSLLSLDVRFVFLNKHATITQTRFQCTSIQLLVTAVIMRLKMKDERCQLSNSLWTAKQPELPSGQQTKLSQDPANCCFDHFNANFPTYDKSWNPCKQCPDCSRQRAHGGGSWIPVFGFCISDFMEG